MTDVPAPRGVQPTAVALWTVSRQGETVTASPALCELLGRDPRKTPGLSPADLMTVLGRRSDDAGGDGDWLNLLLHTARGAVLMEGRQRITYGDDGSIATISYEFTPAGERTAVRLRQTDLMIEAQRIAHVGSWYWYPASNEIWWSEELYRLYRVAPGTEPSVEASQRLIHHSDLLALRAAVESAFAGEPRIEWEGRQLLPDGEVRWIREVADAEFDADGNLVRLSGTAQDITELRAASREAAEGRERLALMKSVAEGAMLSATLVEVLERTAQAVIEHTPWEPVTAHLLPEWIDADAVSVVTLPHHDAKAAAATAGLAAAQTLLSTVRQSATITAIALSPEPAAQTLIAVPVLLDGRPVAVVQFAVDRPRLDEPTFHVLTQFAALLARVAEREHAARSLRAARDDATLEAQRKAKLLAVMSHEIRTPMSGVVGLVDLLLETTLDERQRQMTTAMREAGEALLRVVNDVLDLSRADSGRIEAKSEEFDLRALVEGAVSLLAPSAHEKRVELVLDIDPAVPDRVVGDPGLLAQAVTNLCANAVKFTDQGHVLVTLSPVADALEPLYELEVTDTGVGFEDADTGWVFEPFAQSDQSASRSHDGTGLGLPITRAIADTLGGSVHCRSEPGVGSTFTLTLPLLPIVPEAEESDQLAELPVLLVGHSPVTHRALAHLMGGLGAEVSVAAADLPLERQLPRWAPARTRRLIVVDDSLRLAESGDDEDAREVDDDARPTDARPTDAEGDVPVDGEVDSLRGTDGAGPRAEDALTRLARLTADDPTMAIVVLVPTAGSAGEETARALSVTTLSKPVRRDALVAAVQTAFSHAAAEVDGSVTDLAEDTRTDAPGSPAAGYPGAGASSVDAVPTSAAGAPGLDVPATDPGRSLWVLVVEDNQVNQLVAAGYLESMGHQVDLVDNGQAASEALQGEHPYDLVLMDCRMPGMDGYETTRAVRAQEAGSGRRTPIIALTASVLDDEQERAYASGMDGIVAKPIDRDKLATTLQLWGSQPRESLTPAPELPPILDVQRVRELRNLSDDLFTRARRSFLAAIGGELRELAHAVDDESGALPRMAHALAGAAQTVGLLRLGSLLANLEQHCYHESIDQLRQRLDEIVLVARASVAALREV